MALTASQNAAVNESGRSILVSAAAGSGKTYTLTKRIIKRITCDKANIERMLIVTFTRSAAAEMKAKITSAIAEEISKHPDDEHLQRQMLHVSNAKICTIDSFFIEPVKNHFDILGLPAKIRLADELELFDIKQAAFDETLEEMYMDYGINSSTKIADIGNRNEFTDLISTLTKSKNTKKLMEIILELYDSLSSSNDGIELLNTFKDRLYNSSEEDFFCTVEGKIIKDDIITTLNVKLNTIIYTKSILYKDENVYNAYHEGFDSAIDSLKLLIYRIQAKPFSDLLSSIDSFEITGLKSMKKGTANKFSDNCRNVISDLKKYLKDIKKTLASLTPEQIKYEFIYMSNVNKLLYKILSKYDVKYSKMKAEKGLCEFADMPKFLLKLLSIDEVRKEIAGEYDEVYIDEYQDVNEIQDNIFKLIGNNARFMVGDIKQSIYGFRDAMPSLFASYKREFPIYTEAKKESYGCTVFMSENFRCDESVIDFTNKVCATLFSLSGDEIGYTKNDDLVYKKSNPEGYKPNPVRIEIFENPNNKTQKNVDDEDFFKDEAKFCANEILKLITNGKKPDGSNITLSDIAILIRVKSDAERIAKELKKANIEYCISANNDLFKSLDMRAILDLLKAIDDPYDDMAMCSVLTNDEYSGKSFMSLEEVVSVRNTSSKDTSLYTSLETYGNTDDNLATPLSFRIKEFLVMLSRLRALSRRLSADKLLLSIKALPMFSKISESYAFIYLYDLACEYVKREWNGLYSFIKHCQRLSEGKSQAKKEASNTDAVNIMTIHQSKGLEYNTVFIFDAAHEFSKDEAKNELNFNRDICAAAKTLCEKDDGDGNIAVESYKGIIKDAVIKANTKNSLYEEIRILYVALTRARENLYITATVKKPEELFEKVEASKNSSIASIDSKSYLEWILNATYNSGEEDFYKITLHRYSEGSNIETEENIRESEQIQVSEKDRHYISLMNSDANEKDNTLLYIPSKIAASKVENNILDKILYDPTNGMEDYDKEAILAKMELLSSSASIEETEMTEKAPTASNIGTATHAFLQFCDFKNLRENGILKEIERLKNEEFLSLEVADMINLKDVERFLKSKLFSLIESSTYVEREFKFGIFRNASELTENKELKEKLKDRKIYVQGAIDLLFKDSNDNIYLCDYKTDRIYENERNNISLYKERLRRTHAHQINEYKRAINEIFSKPPHKMFIYSMPLGDIIEM